MMRLCSLLFLLSIDIQVEGRVSPYPVLLPAWPSSYAMNKSTIAMASNSAGFFNATLAAQFGIVAFDHNNVSARVSLLEHPPSWWVKRGHAKESCVTPQAPILHYFIF